MEGMGGRRICKLGEVEKQVSGFQGELGLPLHMCIELRTVNERAIQLVSVQSAAPGAAPPLKAAQTVALCFFSSGSGIVLTSQSAG